MRPPLIVLGLLTALGFVAYTALHDDPEYGEDWMDHPDTRDDALDAPDNHLVSQRPGLIDADRDRPVIVAAHGFSASTYEWEEFRDYAEANSDVLVSLVLLGGHGRDLDAFEAASWTQWGKPILDEYNALVAQGYTNISLAGASTGGTLILQQLAAGAYAPVAPRRLYFVDVLVEPMDKKLKYIRLLGWIFGTVQWQGHFTETERQNWYINRPWRTLVELHKLISEVKDALNAGIALPEGAQMFVWKTTGDKAVDPVSAQLIDEGLQPSDAVEVQMIESDLHVITRLQGRPAGLATETDRDWQRRIFDTMIAQALPAPTPTNGQAPDSAARVQSPSTSR